LGQGNRELLTGNRKRVLGDFTFLHIPLNFSVHLLIRRNLGVNLEKLTVNVDINTYWKITPKNQEGEEY